MEWKFGMEFEKCQNEIRNRKQYYTLILISIAWWLAVFPLAQPIFVIVITFYSPSCLGQETWKGSFGLGVKLSPATCRPAYQTRAWWRLYTVPLIAECQAG